MNWINICISSHLLMSCSFLTWQFHSPRTLALSQCSFFIVFSSCFSIKAPYLSKFSKFFSKFSLLVSVLFQFGGIRRSGSFRSPPVNVQGALVVFSYLRGDLKVKWSFLCGFVLRRELVNKWNCCKLTLSPFIGIPQLFYDQIFPFQWFHSPEECPLISWVGRERGQRTPIFGLSICTESTQTQ